ncbi:DHH family phosphoesterase, partial [Candidatus Uhrbacteria bacterium]|nr:DHH family phosphoesterase [Candidatus Uhrbacteria bacterium]
LLLTDQRPDGDTFGSSLAFFHYLRSIGKRVTLYATTAPLTMHQWLPGIELITRDAQYLRDPSVDLVMSFDSSREELIKSLTQDLRAPLIVVDHHMSNTRFGELNVIDTSASSTCEVVNAYMRAQHVRMTDDMAKCLLMGMLTDTGFFYYSAASGTSFEMAARLLSQGGSLKTVVDYVEHNVSIARLQLWGRIFSRLVYARSWHAAATWYTQEDLEETGATAEDIADMSDYLGRVLDVDTTVFLKQQADGVKVSLRSHNRDVLALARQFGGGGHTHACGFFMEGAQLTHTGDRAAIV